MARMSSLVVLLFTLCLQPALAAVGALPDFTKLAKENSPAVVNISTSIKQVKGKNRLPPGFSVPEIPDDSPLSEFFRRFFGEEGPACLVSIRAPRSARASSSPRMATSSPITVAGSRRNRRPHVGPQ